MTFIQFVKQWTDLIFAFFCDLYSEIMSYDFTAFAFWASIVCGALCMVSSLFVYPHSLAKNTQSVDRDMIALNRCNDRVLMRDVFRLHRQHNRLHRAIREQFVTIEGKRYYRRGLVSHGRRMTNADRIRTDELDYNN